MQEIMRAVRLVREAIRVLTKQWQSKEPQKCKQMFTHLGMTLFYLIMAINKTEYARNDTMKLAAELLQSMKDDKAGAALKAVEVADSMIAGITEK
ncbi:unnamed protein product [Nippostrongylus brasiliensis]|uniref:Tetratricopeptide repeat protein 30 n=1 Tax=Nippostrongylus brasiliensis TaxID=27835 RepID=A0A0N4YA15_NIPBR|nr:unnamed protein product [Nippostrongylus brasiliensis]